MKAKALLRLIATNSKTNSDTLKLLADSDDVLTRQAVAENKNTDSETLKTLTKNINEEYDVIKAVCSNPNTDIETINSLVYSENFLFRSIVAGCKKINSELLNILSKDDCYEVRLNVAENPNTDIKTLKDFTKDENIYVCRAATKRLEKII